MSATEPKRVIVFGGAFSPPTLAHEALIHECLDLPGYDEVWLFPSGNRTDKNISVTHEHQLAMLSVLRNIVFRDNERLKIDDREVKRRIATETDDTYRELLAENPDTAFSFVYGADSYSSITGWQNGTWLARNMPVLIAPRNGARLPGNNAHISILPPLSLELQHLSSTAVRGALERGEDVSTFVSEPIATYIRDHDLFS